MKVKVWFPVNQSIVEKQIELNTENNKVLVKVKAFGINRADLSQLYGGYYPPKGVTEVLGLEFSGIVEETFKGSSFVEGDRVMGLVQGGAYSDYISIEESLLIKIPDLVSFIQAASLPEAWCTVLLNLKEIGNLQKGQRVLIHSATGSVGSVAIQYAKYCGCYVIATTRSKEKLDFLKNLGADVVVLSSDLTNHIEKIKVGGGVDFILDSVGRDTFIINQKLLNLDGTIVYIGLMSGSDSVIDLNSLLMRRQKIIGSTLRSQPLDVRSNLMNYFSFMMSYIIENDLFIPIAKVFEWKNTAEALSFMKNNKNMGKIIVEL